MAGKHWVFDEHRFVQRELQGDHLIMHLDSGEYYTLEGSANLIFAMILRDEPVERILSELSAKYPDVPLARLREDTRAFVDDLKKRKIITALR